VSKQDNALVHIGIGIAIGGSALWMLTQFWPILLIGGGLALAINNTEKETHVHVE